MNIFSTLSIYLRVFAPLFMVLIEYPRYRHTFHSHMKEKEALETLAASGEAPQEEARKTYVGAFLVFDALYILICLFGFFYNALRYLR